MFTKTYMVFVEVDCVLEVRAHNEEDALQIAKERLKEMRQVEWLDKVSVELG